MLTTLNLAIGPLLAGVAWFSLAKTLAVIAAAPQPSDPREWLLEDIRVGCLRAGSRWFRFAEPLVRELMEARIAERFSRKSHVVKSLRKGGDVLPWTAEEFLAVAMVTAIGISFAAAVAAYYIVGGIISLITLAALFPILFYGRVAGLHTRARRRVANFRRELPYVTDLMALTMEAGAEFIEVLETTVEKVGDSVAGQEFRRVERLMNRGESMERALDNLRVRMDCEDVCEWVFAVKNAQQLGAPLSQTLLDMADRMRLKRVQRAEEQVGKAQTQMSFPGIVIMTACLLIVLAMFLLPVIDSGGIF